jgi:hypothetical protein
MATRRESASDAVGFSYDVSVTMSRGRNGDLRMGKGVVTPRKGLPKPARMFATMLYRDNKECTATEYQFSPKMLSNIHLLFIFYHQSNQNQSTKTLTFFSQISPKDLRLPLYIFVHTYRIFSSSSVPPNSAPTARSLDCPDGTLRSHRASSRVHSQV